MRPIRVDLIRGIIRTFVARDVKTHTWKIKIKLDYSLSRSIPKSIVVNLVSPTKSNPLQSLTTSITIISHSPTPPSKSLSLKPSPPIPRLTQSSAAAISSSSRALPHRLNRFLLLLHRRRCELGTMLRFSGSRRAHASGRHVSRVWSGYEEGLRLTSVTGLNNNEYQIGRGKELNRIAGVDKTCDFVKADFMKMPFSDNKFDAVYAIEVTCHAPDAHGCYKEIYRVLKPGQSFAAYEWCMTEAYDPQNKEHQHIKCRIIRTTELATAQEKLHELENQKEEILKFYSPGSIQHRLECIASADNMNLVIDLCSSRNAWYAQMLAKGEINRDMGDNISGKGMIQGVSAVRSFYELLSQSSLSVLHPDAQKPVAPTVEALSSVLAPELALRLYLQCAEAANDSDLEPVAYEFFTQAYILYEEEISDSKAQIMALHLIIGTLQRMHVFGVENRDTLTHKATRYSAKLLKKPDQCRAVYACSQLFWVDDQDDVKDGERDVICHKAAS
ncbi:hypothetical protein ACFE04_028297 [Oxalis oulophora]